MSRVKINLAPLEELENPNWWIPDVATLLVVFCLAYFGLEYHFSILRDEIATNDTKTAQIQTQRKTLKKKLKDAAAKQQKIAELEAMYGAISRITESKMRRYLPIIIVEHIQNLMPEGVWLSQLTLGDGEGGPKQSQQNRNAGRPRTAGQNSASDTALTKFKDEITVEGFALDNILLAEFMTQIKATAAGEFDETDIRTQIFFREANLTISRGETKPVARDANGKELMRQVVGFELKIRFDEHRTGPGLGQSISSLTAAYRQRHLSERM